MFRKRPDTFRSLKMVPISLLRGKVMGKSTGWGRSINCKLHLRSRTRTHSAGPPTGKHAWSVGKNRPLWLPHLSPSSQVVRSMGDSPEACHTQSGLMLQAAASACPCGDVGSPAMSQLYIPSHHKQQEDSESERSVHSDGKLCANEPGNLQMQLN